MEIDHFEQPQIPNGGWGWVIVAAVALINMFNQSIVSVFGLLFGEHLQGMNQETTGAALVTNLNSVALNFSGLIIGPAIKNSSPRKVAFVGCLFTSSGLIISALSTELWHVIVGYSIFVGIGLGLIAPSTFIAINSYFTTKRGRAVGIALAGTGLGQMVVPHIVRILLEHYGFRTTALVMGGLALNGLIGASLFRPLKQKTSNLERNIKEVKLLLDLKSQDTRKTHSDFEVELEKTESLIQAKKKSQTNKLCKKIFARLAKSMDLELLKDYVFWSIIIGMALVYTASTNFSMLFPYFLQNSVHLSRKHTAFCMSALAGADIVSRLLLPFLTDKLKVPYRFVFLFGAAGLFVGRGVIAELSDFNSLVVMSIVYGSFKAATVINNNLTISAHCKQEQLAGGLGFNMISKGTMAITLGQLLAWIRDYTKSYSVCLHAQNGLILIVIILWVPEFIFKYFKERECKKSARTDSIP